MIIVTPPQSRADKRAIGRYALSVCLAVQHSALHIQFSHSYSVTPFTLTINTTVFTLPAASECMSFKEHTFIFVH